MTSRDYHPASEKQAEAQLCALPCKLLPERSPFSSSPGDPLPPSAQPRTRSRPRPRASSRPGFLPRYHSPGGHDLARLRAQLSHHARALRPQPALRAHAASGAGADRGGPGGLRGGGGLAHSQHGADAHGSASRYPPLEQAQRPGAGAAHLGYGRRLGTLGGKAAAGRCLHRSQAETLRKGAGRGSGPGAPRRGRATPAQEGTTAVTLRSSAPHRLPPAARPAPTSGTACGVTCRRARACAEGRGGRTPRGAREARPVPGTGRCLYGAGGAGPAGDGAPSSRRPREHQHPALATAGKAVTPGRKPRQALRLDVLGLRVPASSAPRGITSPCLAPGVPACNRGVCPAAPIAGSGPVPGELQVPVCSAPRLPFRAEGWLASQDGGAGDPALGTRPVWRRGYRHAAAAVVPRPLPSPSEAGRPGLRGPACRCPGNPGLRCEPRRAERAS